MSNACLAIAIAPESVGRPYEYVREGYRRYSYGRHVIYYQIMEDGSTLISRVLHDRMDFDRHLGFDGKAAIEI